MKAVKVLFFTAVLLLGVNTAMAQAKLGHIDVATPVSYTHLTLPTIA